MPDEREKLPLFLLIDPIRDKHFFSKSVPKQNTMETRHEILTSKWSQVEVNIAAFSQQKILHLNKLYVSSYWHLHNPLLFMMMGLKCHMVLLCLNN